MADKRALVGLIVGGCVTAVIALWLLFIQGTVDIPFGAGNYSSVTCASVFQEHFSHGSDQAVQPVFQAYERSRCDEQRNNRTWPVVGLGVLSVALFAARQELAHRPSPGQRAVTGR